MQTTTAPTWSWPDADPALIEALRDGALEGLEAVPASAGTVVSAEFFGEASPRNVREGCVTETGRVNSPTVRITMRDPEREIIVSLDPFSLCAETPAEARESAASVVLARAGVRESNSVFDDPEALSDIWGYRAMQDLTKIKADPEPVPTLDQLRARIRKVFGESVESHERDGTPSGQQIAEQVRKLSSDAKRAGFDLFDVVSKEVTAAQADRLNVILGRALEVQQAEHALRTLESGE